MTQGSITIKILKVEERVKMVGTTIVTSPRRIGRGTEKLAVWGGLVLAL